MAQGGKREGAGRPKVFPWDTIAIGESFSANYDVKSTSKYWMRKIPTLSFKVEKSMKTETVDGVETKTKQWVVTRLS